jgi:hypothetical protein
VRRRSRWGTAALFALEPVLGCASRGAQGSPGPLVDAGAPEVGPDAGADGAPDAASRVDGGPILGGDAGPCAPYGCSADLHDVVDCNGNTIKTCPAAEGCAPGGTCVAACDAAAANQSTVGCEYFVIDPGGGLLTCLAVYVVNTWTTDATLSIDYAGQTFNTPSYARIPAGSGTGITYAPLPNGKLAPGRVAVVFLNAMASPSTNCPLTGPNPAGSGAPGTLIGSAYHLVSDVPVVAYDIYPYGGGSSSITSATLLIPTGAWGINYIAVSPWVDNANSTTPRTNIVALEDGTAVTINPVAPIVAGPGVVAASAGQAQTYMLDRGQMLQLDQMDELTGSPIQSTKPVGVWGSQECIDIDQCCCDSAHQQLPPVQALGHQYVGVRYRNRVDNTPDETPPWTLVGAAAGTKLTWDPSAPQGAPTTLGVGTTATFRAAGPFVVQSQDAAHPFYMAAFMTGGGAFLSRGDAEFVNVIPAQQYVSSYVFFTDPTYPETDLVVVRQKSKAGKLEDVTLDCAGVLTGWQPAGTSGQFEYTRVDLVRHDFAPQGNCDNGRHAIASAAPFGLTVWGWGTLETLPSFVSTYVSYAYPAGAGVQTINTVIAGAGN